MQSRPNANPATTDRNYSEEEAAWLTAVAKYQQRHKLPFLYAVDYLSIARELGYRKVMGDAGSQEGG